jgi:putative DNA methylase
MDTLFPDVRIYPSKSQTKISAIENTFPVKTISLLAEHESWRKEVYRPIYYIHKWWARRLGSVFRAIILGCCIDQDDDISQLFYDGVQFPEVVIFDPFMGSGTTAGEAIKLGCRVIGRDINPVSTLIVKAALQSYSRTEVINEFQRIKRNVSNKILSFYKTKLPNGEQGLVLYYFWVMVVLCPYCNYNVALHKDRVFAKHAYPKKYPDAKSFCPECGAINGCRYNDTEKMCHQCGAVYNPSFGVISNNTVTCPNCRKKFKVIEAVRREKCPPSFKMYAKLVVNNRGQKEYLPIDQSDHESFRRAELMLEEYREYIPPTKIISGYNTNQVLKYNYEYWHQMFNSRQLSSIALLVSEIRKINNKSLRELFACLLSGTIEFNNMFTSFKGEGTGAVRHIFSHHILKPERTPIEANIWGTPKSSGSFSTLFESRICRALDYKEQPFEIDLEDSNGKICSKKIYLSGREVNKNVVDTYHKFSRMDAVYLSCGDSAKTDIPDNSVDYVITDPPFFDNVHYSQLADFFYVWLRQILCDREHFTCATTRSNNEVQDTSSDRFTIKLTSVFRECYRVLKENGLLVFTYHHSRIDGWLAVYKAVRESGFFVYQNHPVKSEMSVSVPIQQSKIAVNFDIILVCRKLPSNNKNSSSLDNDNLLRLCFTEAEYIVRDIQETSIRMTPGDVKVIIMGCLLSKLFMIDDLHRELELISQFDGESDFLAEQIIKNP